MARRSFIRKRLVPTSHKPNPGSAPGVLTVSPLSYPTELLMIGYGPDGYMEQSCVSVDDIAKFITAWPVVWVNVIGLGNLQLIEDIGNLFALDRLSLEDVLDTSHRPKVEYYEHYMFTIIKAMQPGEQFESEQLSIFLKKNVVVVFEEKPGSSFGQVRDRIRRGTGKIRHSGTDYLYYALLDEVIDKYFPILDRLNHQLVTLEDEIMTNAVDSQPTNVIQSIHHTKSDLLLMHRNIWPVSDIISMIIREETPLITKAVRGFLRDCYDHAMQANELTQFYRDTASGLLNTFLAYEGHKTNDIVKTLTIISSIFIPLTFISGIYGMNFDTARSKFNMPELEWAYGYPFALFMMLMVALFMLVRFKRKGWV
ncbi:MAG: magnesium/cobalt transporter CorA [Alphaproteobacteria bacterium]|nr:magnesium/cobalt transporter CorA [Alphaproteobacteria bacterium]